MVNPKLATGGIEVRSDRIEVLNRSRTPPFPLEDGEAVKVAEDLRLTYRYLDLRRPRMLERMASRHRIAQAARGYLDGQGFLEVETPILTKSTPEGARDYLVPSRVMPGAFYALPQAPQQYKQLLMVAGVDRYFQIARCFRDEDLRADRQPEFTQIDVEMSFVTPEDIYGVVDGLMAAVMAAAGHPAPALPLPRMTYDEAMDRYGSDKPDLRFGMDLTDLGDLFRGSSFKVFAQTVWAGRGGQGDQRQGTRRGPDPRHGRVDRDWPGTPGSAGSPIIRVQEDGTWKSPIVKFFSEAEKAGLAERLEVAAGRPRAVRRRPGPRWSTRRSAGCGCWPAPWPARSPTTPSPSRG